MPLHPSACFNREFIAELNDIAAANLLELENLSEQPSLTLGGSRSSSADGPSALSSEKRLDFAAARNEDIDLLTDLEENLSVAIKAGRPAKAADMIRVAQQNEDATSVSRVVWRALLHSSPDAVQAALDASLPDFNFVDDINSRTCLHEAALAGNLTLVRAAVQYGIDVGQRDNYGRAAISYAAMNGHADVCTFLLTQPGVDAATADLDGFSPLVLAVINGRTEVLRILLSHGVSVEPREITDLIPLGLASQAGHADITAMLLQRGAKITSNPEGLTPQALAAREGHVECLRLLMQAKANPDAPEKGTLWTPLFFAAENGHADCIRVLLESQCNIAALDEKGKNAIFYAAWKGHIDCLLILLEAASATERPTDVTMASTPLPTKVNGAAAAAMPRKKTREEEQLEELEAELEADGIPSLSLPPPIIPFRTYGHNYLDKRSLVTIALTDSSVKLYKHHDALGLDQFSTSSVKLVMTSKPDASATYIPHNIVLPLADEREVFSFQVEALEKLSIEWELRPTFGSKIIGKAVALPSSFDGMTDRKRFVLPLQDTYLRVVGEINFEIDFVKPFDGVQLEIGGRVETYWKSLLPGSSSAPGGGIRMTPTGAEGESGSLTSPAINTPQASASIIGSIGSTSALVPAAGSASVVTASSLSGDYLRLVVQVTKDGVAVVYPAFTLPMTGLDVYIGSVTGDQYLDFAQSTGRLLRVPGRQAATMGLQDWVQALKGKMVTLEALLSVLPASIGIDLNILYPSSADVRGNPSLPKIEVNHFVDTILHAVYRAGTHNLTQSRKILFTSRSPTVCTALNWKQPNYAVFFASDCGLQRTAEDETVLAPSDRNEPDPRRLSVSEAVRFAKNNNLLGLAIDATLLNSVPELVQTIKAAGFLLITIGTFTQGGQNTSNGAAAAAAVGGQGHSDEATPAVADAAVDGVIEDGILVCKSSKVTDAVFV